MTICEKCGAERDFIAEACDSCLFQPTTNRELAIASLLTTRFAAGVEFFGTEQEQLQLLADSIKAGNKLVLDESELTRHEESVADFVQIRTIDVYVGLFRFFLPALIWLAILWGAIWLLKC